jgi:Leucine-rich repeat (LRR) protein
MRLLWQVLHLQGNAIVFFAGLVANTELLELRLDKNKIRQLDPHSTQSLRRLRVLSLDDNGLRTLSNFNELMSIEVRLVSWSS